MVRWSSSGGRGGFQQSFRKVLVENKIGGADDDSTLYGIFQFADVARPVVLHQASERSRRDSLDAATAFLRIARNEIFGEGLDVFSVLAERWHGDGDDIKTVEEVRSELLLAHRLLQVFVAGRQEADVQLDGSRATDAGKFAFLKYAQQLGLERKREFSHFIEEDTAAQIGRASCRERG